jgi:hypothetical protein
MRKLNVLMIAGIVLLTGSAYAEDEEATDATDTTDAVDEAPEAPTADVSMEAPAVSSGKSGGYGSAGCGLGTLLFSPSNGFTQVFAATTNGTSASQTFGITSGTSNCDGAGFQPGSTAAFVQTNRSALAKDAARGKGATITGLTEVAGCKNPKAVGQALQKNFAKVFPDASVADAQVSESVISVLKKDVSLGCGNLD